MLTLLLGLAGAAASAAPADPPTTGACTAARLRAFVAPTGIQQRWPVAARLPAHLDQEPGVLISDPGHVMDGYSHRLLIDATATAAYVVQRGGFAGAQTVYGPLPVAACRAGRSDAEALGVRPPS